MEPDIQTYMNTHMQTHNNSKHPTPRQIQIPKQ